MGPHTLGYAPWEQINNEKNVISENRFIFNGCNRQEMLTGEHPFIQVEIRRRHEANARTLTIKNLELDTPINQNLKEFTYINVSKPLHQDQHYCKL